MLDRSAQLEVNEEESSLQEDRPDCDPAWRRTSLFVLELDRLFIGNRRAASEPAALGRKAQTHLLIDGNYAQC